VYRYNLYLDTGRRICVSDKYNGFILKKNNINNISSFVIFLTEINKIKGDIIIILINNRFMLDELIANEGEVENAHIITLK
jgi:hypothetical protein